MNKRGSALLVVMIMSTVIVIILGAIVHKVTLFHQFALQRLQHEKRMNLANALLNYGIAWCNAIEKQKGTETVYRKVFEQWGPYGGEVEIRVEAGKYQVYVYLKDGTSEPLKLTCSVARKDTM